VCNQFKQVSSLVFELVVCCLFPWESKIRIFRGNMALPGGPGGGHYYLLKSRG